MYTLKQPFQRPIQKTRESPKVTAQRVRIGEQLRARRYTKTA